MMYELGNSTKSNIVVEELKKAVQNGPCTVVTGAGISAPNGIPLLSDRIGNVPLKDFFQECLWKEQPERAFETYRIVLKSWRTTDPTVAHSAIAHRCLPVITQNIDGLHRDAGSKNVLELHGNLRELICRCCANVFSSSLCFNAAVPVCPTCGSQLYPGFTLEGEPVRHIARAMEWVGCCDVLLIIGTQLAMNPIRQLRETVIARSKIVIWVSDDANYWIPLLLDTT